MWEGRFPELASLNLSGRNQFDLCHRYWEMKICELIIPINAPSTFDPSAGQTSRSKWKHLCACSRAARCRISASTQTVRFIVTVSSPSAPNLKGRPRKKKLSISQRRDSQGQAQGQGSSGSTQGSAAVAAPDPSSPDCRTATKVRLEKIRFDKGETHVWTSHGTTGAG